MSSSVRTHSRGPSSSGRPSHAARDRQAAGARARVGSEVDRADGIVDDGAGARSPGRARSAARGAAPRSGSAPFSIIWWSPRKSPWSAVKTTSVSSASAARVERVEDAPDVVVELRDHAVVARRGSCSCSRVGEERPAGIRPLERRAAEALRPHAGGRAACRRTPRDAPSGSTCQHVGRGRSGRTTGAADRTDGADRGSSPRRRTARRRVSSQSIGAVGDPGRRVVLLGELVLPRLRVVPRCARPPRAASGAAARRRARGRRGRGGARSAGRTAAARSPSSSGPTCGREADVVDVGHQLDVVEAEVRPVPVGRHERRVDDRLDAAGREVGEVRREVRLAEERGREARRRRSASRASRPPPRRAGRCRCGSRRACSDTCR